MGEEVSVSSSIYNLAGPEAKRTDFLKSLVLGGILEGVDSLAEVIARGYRDGPAIRFRNYLRWAREDPEFQQYLGITSGTLRSLPRIDRGQLRSVLEGALGQTLRIDAAEVGYAQYAHWVRQYLGRQLPDRVNDTFRSRVEGGNAIVTFELRAGELAPLVLALPLADFPDYTAEARYLYVEYAVASGEPTVGPEFVGPVSPLPAGADWPVDGSWTPELDERIERVAELQSQHYAVATYSDGRPAETAVAVPDPPRFQAYQELHLRYSRDELFSDVVNGTETASSVHTVRTCTQRGEAYWFEPEAIGVRVELVDVASGVRRTVTTYRREQRLQVIREVQDTTRETVLGTWGPRQVLIYRQGLGSPDPLLAPRPELEALFGIDASDDGFYPPIPFRYQNVSIDPMVRQYWVTVPDYCSYGDTVYFAASATTTDEDWAARVVTVVSHGEDNMSSRVLVEGIGEDHLKDVMDAAGLVFRHQLAHTWNRVLDAPVPIVPPRADSYKLCRRAFKKAFNAEYHQVAEAVERNGSIGDIDYVYAVCGVSLDTAEPAARRYIYRFVQNLLETTRTAWDDPASVEAMARAIGEADPKVRGAFAPPSWRELEVQSRHKDLGTTNYRTLLRWGYVYEERGNGRLWKTREDGSHVRFERNEIQINRLEDPFPSGTDDRLNNRIELVWQETGYSWRRLTVVGFHYVNKIYRDHAQTIRADRALAPSTHGDSRFIVPLHESVYEKLPMKDRTQMATACCILLFNCYTVREVAWYEEDWFKVIAIVAIVIVAIVGALFSGGQSLGLLGTAASVGATLGLGGTAAIIVGAAINALAGLLVAFLIQELAIAVFGEKWGGVIGAVLALAVSFGAAGVYDFDRLFASAEGWNMLIGATSTAFSQYLALAAREMAEQVAESIEKMKGRMDAIQERQDELARDNRIDPTIVSKYINELTERPRDFLARTLMTGSDIVDVTVGYLHSFADLHLQPRLP